MILSHSLRCVFVAIPKTGTHSIRQALRPHLQPGDAEQVSLFAQSKLPYPELARINHGHISAAQLRPCLGAAAFDAYFKFSFVRNPFARFVSYAAFMGREQGEFERAPRQYMKYLLDTVQPWNHILFRPQHEFVADADGRLLVDAVGRVETMQQSWDAICARIGIESGQLAITNQSSHLGYADYYDAELIERIGSLYHQDFKLFGYPPDGAFDGVAAPPLAPGKE